MITTETFYGHISAEHLEAFAKVKLIAFDVDGVFSDGRIYLGNNGEELKAFHTRDGYGIKAIQACGVVVAVITGRRSNIVEQRMMSLGVEHILQGCEDKQQALLNLQQSLNIGPDSTASMGDDVPDIGMFTQSSLPIAVADAHPSVAQKAIYITQHKGGFGAVREVCDLILHTKGKLGTILSSST